MQAYLSSYGSSFVKHLSVFSLGKGTASGEECGRWAGLPGFGAWLCHSLSGQPWASHQVPVSSSVKWGGRSLLTGPLGLRETRVKDSIECWVCRNRRSVCDLFLSTNGKIRKAKQKPQKHISLFSYTQRNFRRPPLFGGSGGAWVCLWISVPQSLLLSHWWYGESF